MPFLFPSNTFVRPLVVLLLCSQFVPALVVQADGDLAGSVCRSVLRLKNIGPDYFPRLKFAIVIASIVTCRFV